MKAWQRRTTVFLVLLVAAVAAESLASLSDTAKHLPPNYYGFTPPAVRQGYMDPVFGETVIRGTDALHMGSPGPFDFLSAEYSSSALTNANDSYVRLTDSIGNQNLFSLPDFKFFRRIPLGSSSPSDYWWHTTNPNLLYGVPGNRLEVYNISTNKVTTVRTFPAFSDINGMGESNLSHDGNRVALRGKMAGGGPDMLLIYEFSSNSIIASVDIGSIPGFFDASIAASGNRVVIAVFPSANGHFEVWNVNKAAGTITRGIVLSNGAGHNDKAMGPDGRDYMIMVDSWYTNTVYRVDLQTGAQTPLHQFWWTAGIPLGLHISTNSMDKDGWIYVSTYIDNNFDPNPGQLWIPYIGEIMRMRWDTGAIERLAHNRSKMTSYWNIPRASISTSGRYLFWSSNYRNNHEPSAPADYADTYMIDFGPVGGPSAVILDGLGGLHNSGYLTASLAPLTPYFYWDVAADIEFAATGYYVLDRLGGVHAGGGAPAPPPTAYFAFPIARDLELVPGGGMYVLDGFGGVNPGGGAAVTSPSLYYGWDIARDLELTSNNGFYVLDGFGGIYSGNGAPSLTGLTPYFGFDIAVDLEMAPGSGFYVLDWFGGIHAGGGAPPLAPPVYWGYRFARDLELSSPGFYVLDGKGDIHAGGGAPVLAIGSHHFGWDIARDFELR